MSPYLFSFELPVIEAGEGHVARTDHDRYQKIAKSGGKQHANQKYHCCPAHGEETVDDIGRNEFVIREGNLQPNCQSHNTCDGQENECSADGRETRLFVANDDDISMQPVDQQLSSLPWPR